MIEIKVPARVCFYGDHQDYLGLPVIAGAIDRFIRLKADTISERKYLIKLLDLNEEVIIDLDDTLQHVPQNDYYRSCMAILRNQGFQFNDGYVIEISGNIPLNAGLSSSSALVVAWLRFLVATQGKTNEISDYTIGRWAYEAEVLFFNQPGGLMDQYTIAQKGLLYIDTQSGKSVRLKAEMGSILVAESGLSKKTLEVLKNGRVYAQNAVAAIKETYPEFNLLESTSDDYERYKHLVPQQYQEHWYAAIFNYQITLRAKEELQKEHPDVQKLGRLMNEHQTILQNQIQNTPKEMVQMMDNAIKAGALGAKTIGSGGGGCMVALVKKEQLESVGKAFLEAGAKNVYEVRITM